MKIADFQIGMRFLTCTAQLWQCTDVGIRTILAIEIDPSRDEHWYNGPPYAVPEEVFDETSIRTCYRSEKEAILESLTDDFEQNIHPEYPSEVIKTFIRYLSEQQTYPNERLFRIDRVGEDGEIHHPYAAREIDDEWQILVYLPFTQAFTDFSEAAFIRMRVATEQDFWQRKTAWIVLN
ncbi:hypothetical protein K1J23_04010 [Enterobacter hormaechei]|uniref:hypothetical protein n=1 Tax=Enterobacter TaxID=547 RepID=UPI00079B856E|nr:MULTISPECIES: hypothetical protein [Enterobacter]MCU2656122.1 hypothetical protein [Enterobacter hormaechei subsp. hoffmannii]MDU4338730.1 hypothetical protein [Streptococcus mitis]SAD36382.1 Uncharacterised protein [Enterobacter cloacae]MBJ6381009.1 hypothetical protein [Enterobacter hormaechei]MBJ6400800.1 hypothetical protein [Enterobacter hormaechei]